MEGKECEEVRKPVPTLPSPSNSLINLLRSCGDDAQIFLNSTLQLAKQAPISSINLREEYPQDVAYTSSKNSLLVYLHTVVPGLMRECSRTVRSSCLIQLGVRATTQIAKVNGPQKVNDSIQQYLSPLSPPCHC
ncbi:hypothetical protein J6590_073001 [Homalodisca vitripennis]|nr:hypothetical protein J6590_073001 [Homalodisca vitripennis]